MFVAFSRGIAAIHSPTGHTAFLPRAVRDGVAGITPAMGMPTHKSLISSLSSNSIVRAIRAISGKCRARAGDPTGKDSLHASRCFCNFIATSENATFAPIRFANAKSGLTAHSAKIERASFDIVASIKVWNGFALFSAAKCRPLIFGSPLISDGNAFPLGWMPAAPCSKMHVKLRFLDGAKSFTLTSPFPLHSLERSPLEAHKIQSLTLPLSTRMFCAIP